MLLWGSPASFAQVIHLTSDRDVHAVGTAIYYYVDESGNQNLREVMKASSNFRISDQLIPNIGITTASYWGRFELINDLDQDAYLELGNTALDSITLFEVISPDSVNVRKTGVRINFLDREFRNNSYLLKLCGHASEPRTFYLKVRHARGTQFPIYIGTLKGFGERFHKEDFIMGIYFGFMILMIFYNIPVFFSVRDTSYAYYVFYVANMTVFNGSLSGYAFEYLWPNQASLSPYEDLFTASLAISGILFATNFLRTRENAPGVHKAFLIFLALYGVGIIFVLVQDFMLATIYLEVLSLLLIILQFTAAIVVIRKGYKPAKFFLAAWSVLLLGVVVFILKDFNIIPYNLLSVHSMKIGSGLEAFVLAIALANRINTYRREKDEAQVQALNSALENERLITGQKIMLETEVEKRTHDLVLEKQKSDNLLLNILPHETAEELKVTGTTRVKSFDTVTIMFTDFKDFTSIAEKLTPEELIAEINQCFSAFDTIISRHKLEKIKTIGDSYMCAGGLPEPSATHAEDAVMAALEMQEFMEKHRVSMEQRYQLHFKMRLGIHTGPVVAGVVGIRKFAYDIWGDAVNIASRIESSGEPGKVNISGDTQAAIAGKFRTTYRGKVQAKNKGSIAMYFVDSRLPDEPAAS